MLGRVDSSPLKRVHLIRHGESTANLQNLVCGSMDVALTARGERQALEFSSSPLIHSLKELPCITSTLQRAKKTAELLKLKVALEIESLNETDTGAWSERTQDELCRHLPHFEHHKTDLTAIYEGGESTQAMLDRSWEAFGQAVNQLQAAELVIVAHGGPLNSIIGNLLGLSFDGFPKFLLEHVTITSLARTSSDPGVWVMERMNAR